MGQIINIQGRNYDFGDKDWKYLQTKQPDSNHVLQAQVISELAGVEITPQQCMAFLAMHRFIQKSQANQDRENFRGRTWESVLKGSATLGERAQEEKDLHGLVVHAPIGTLVEEAPAPAPAPKPGPRKRRQPARAAAAKVAEEAPAITEGTVESAEA